MHKASYYTSPDSTQVRCTLCPHMCVISEGSYGSCNVRKLQDNTLITDTYGQLSAVAIDPIEKKPLYHFYPGKQILSIGSLGCTMKCKHCQNSDISQCGSIKDIATSIYSVEDIEKNISKTSVDLLAFTYNEPVVFYEFMLETAKAVTKNGTRCVMVTNGYINQKPLNELLPHIEAFNVDLKAYNDNFYRKICDASLKPVLNCIENIKQKEKHLEITFLVIPGVNDDPVEFHKMVKFLSKNFGRSQVLHISRYFPKYKMKLPPTPISTITEFTRIAKSELDFVYPGNTGLESNTSTYCPGCGQLLIDRTYYTSKISGMKNNKCNSCGKAIYGKFS
jgi:pyruvate formate lyase activating enzyme